MIIFFLIGIFDTFLLPEFDRFSSPFNPVLLTKPTFLIQLGISQQFGIGNLRTYSSRVEYRYYKISLQSFGDENYRDNIVELAGRFAVLPNVGLGIGIAVLNNWIKDYSNRFAYTVKSGGMLKTTSLEFECHLNHINNSKFSEIDCLPFSYLAGLRYLVNRYVQPYFSIAGVVENNPFFCFGTTIRPLETLRFYAGVKTECFLLEYGVMISAGRIAFSYEGSSHPQLGLSHAFFVNFVGQ